MRNRLCFVVIMSLLYDLMKYSSDSLELHRISSNYYIFFLSCMLICLCLFISELYHLLYWYLLKSDLLQTHCVWESPASSSRLWTAGYSSNVAHESKLQNSSVDPAVRSGLWKNIQDQNCRGFEFRSTERRNTSSSTYLSIVMLNSWKIERMKNILITYKTLLHHNSSFSHC